jgi:hypothetical protein
VQGIRTQVIVIVGEWWQMTGVIGVAMVTGVAEVAETH